MLKVISHREKQIKAARHHFTPTSTAKIKKTDNIWVLVGMEKLEPSYIAGGILSMWMMANEYGISFGVTKCSKNYIVMI